MEYNIDINLLSSVQLLNRNTYKEIFNIYEGEELNNACEKLLARAEVLEDVEEVEDLKLKVKSFIEEFLERENKRSKLAEEDRIKRREQELLEELSKVRRLECEELSKSFKDTLDVKEEEFEDLVNLFRYKSNGSLDGKSIVNYDLVMQNDKYIKEHVRFNTFSNELEIDGEIFNNSDLLTISSYLDRVYMLKDEGLIWNALNRPGNIIPYNPIKDKIELEEWDGVPRIDNFFSEICKSVVTDEDMRVYLREVARMLFFGGISRLYEPGCKFDYMIILKGAQGTCKTTLVRLLALDDQAYSEVTTIDGAPGIENIRGSWMCELAELLAMVRAREVESIKAFITRQYDKYRPPYARASEIVPRGCIFIGTTNEIQFMGDMTGNRRYLPIEVHVDAEEFFNNIEDIKKYILNCWREAYYKYKRGEIYTTIPAKYFNLLERVRTNYQDDDPMEGLIRGYLGQQPVGYEVCSLEVYTKCLNGIRSKFTTRDSRNIATVMNKLDNWVRENDRKYFDGYGRQRYWKKVSDEE